MKFKISFKGIIKYILFFIVWLCFLYLGRFYFYYYDYIDPSYIYYNESLKDFSELRKYINTRE